jgi:hypothetical protein
MSSNIVNQSPYLRTSRDFPNELRELGIVISKSYIEVASAVNLRTIGIFPTNRSALTGESWFITSQKQQTLRQVYTFTSAGNIPHGLDLAAIYAFTKPFGSFTDGTNWYGAIYGSNVAIAGQVSFYITPVNIVILSVGAPAIVSGIIVLEWLSFV